MQLSFGAIARGSALSTVERRAGTYLLASVHGDLATIAIESIKTGLNARRVDRSARGDGDRLRL